MADRKLLFEWPELGLKARASLADDKNPELCEEVWNALPYVKLCSDPP